jgi:hypothetical protein
VCRHPLPQAPPPLSSETYKRRPRAPLQPELLTRALPLTARRRTKKPSRSSALVVDLLRRRPSFLFEQLGEILLLLSLFWYLFRSVSCLVARFWRALVSLRRAHRRLPPRAAAWQTGCRRLPLAFAHHRQIPIQGPPSIQATESNSHIPVNLSSCWHFW